MPLSTLNLKFGMDIAEITSGVNKMEKELSKITKSIQNVQSGVAAGMAAIGAGMVFKKIVDGAVDAQKSMAQVQVAIKSTGGAAGISAGEIDKMANAMKRQTGIDDDLIKSMASVLLTFTKVGKEVFPQATQAIIDMSVRMGGDLQGAAVQVGKALNDPIKGMTALSKVGVSFTENQKAAVKQMVETGHVMDAQKLILRELQTEFGGAAAAARDTLGGALKALQQNIDDAVDSFNGSNGLREAVELVNVMLEDFTDYMTGLRQPTSQASKDLENIGKVLNQVGGFFRGFANVMINGWRDALAAAGAFYKGMMDVGAALAKLVSVVPALGAIGTAIKAAFPHFDMLGKAAGFAGQKIKEAASKDNFQYFDGAVERSKKKMLELAAAAKNVKAPKAAGDDGEGLSKSQIAAAKKAAAELKKEEKTVHDVIAAYAQKNVELQASLDKNKGIADQMAAEKKISDQINVPLKERLAAIAEIGRLSRERLEIERKIAVEGEKVKLTDYLSGLEEANEKLRNKLAGQQELNPLLEAEKKIRDLVKVGLGENLELQNQIRDAAQKQVDLLKEVDHQAALKELKGISDEQQKQVDQLMLKLNGQEELAGLLEQEKKIRENINLTDEEKSKAIASGRDAAAQVKQLTNSLEAQQDTIKDITGSSDSYKKKLENLSAALQTGRINSKQWDDAAKDLWEAQKKNNNAASDFGNKMSAGLEKALSGTKSLKAGLMDMTKTLAAFAANELIFKPLEKGIKGLANKLFGGGDIPKPVNPLTGPQAAPTLANNTQPVGSVAGFGTADSTNLYSASNTLTEIRDLLKKQTEQLASGLTKSSGGILDLPNMAPVGAPGKLTSSADSKGLFEKTKELFKKMTGSVGDAVKDLTKPLSDAATKNFGNNGNLASGVKSGLAGIADSVGNSMKNALTGITKPIGDTIKSMFGTSGAGGSGILSSITNGLKGVFNQITGAFGSLFGGSGGILSNIGGTISSLFGGLKNTLGSIVGGIGSMFGGGGNGGGSFLGGLGKAAGGLLGGIGSLFGIGSRATGGFISANQPYLVGEKGPELIYPAQGGFVLPSMQTTSRLDQLRSQQSAMGGAYTSGFNNYVNGELNRQIFDEVNRQFGLKGNNNVGLEDEVRKLTDQSAMAKARQRIRDAQAGKSIDGLAAQDYLNSYRAIKDEDISIHGIGAANAYTAALGGGNQLSENLRRAQAMGVSVSNRLLSYGLASDADWNKTAGGQGLALGSLAGNLSYQTMGIGANNTSSIAYGSGGIWNPGTWGSHYEQGGGYDWGGGAQGQWNKFHSSNLSYGGGNFIGDSSYGRRQFPGFAGTTFERNRANQGLVDQYGDSDSISSMKWRPGRERAMVDQKELGKYTVPGGIASGTIDPGANLTELIKQWTGAGIKGASLDQLIQMFGGNLPPTASIPTRQETWNEQQKAIDYYNKLTGLNNSTEIGTISAFKQYMRQWLEQSNSSFSGSYSGGSGEGRSLKTMMGDFFFGGIAPVNPMQYNSVNGGYLLGKQTGYGAGQRLPGYARGGRPAPGQPAIIGEDGPEMWVPDSAGRVIPNNQLRGGGAPNITVVNLTSKPIRSDGVKTAPNGRDLIAVIRNVVADDIRTGGQVGQAAKKSGALIKR